MTSIVHCCLFLVALGLSYGDPHFTGQRPFFLIQPMNIGRRTERRLVLSLPKDNIQILNADATPPERGQAFLPTTLTLSLSDSPYNPTKSSRHFPRFHYEADSEESRPMKHWHKGDDGSSHVTFIKGGSKAVHARKVMSSAYKPMKAIIIKPKEIEAKRVRVIETESESVTATKARVIKPQEPMISTAFKAKTHPVSFKKGVLTKGKDEDWAASNAHFTKAKLPVEEARALDEMPPMELNCGGTNDLGWCDLGTNYPSAEVSQIMDVCEELVTKMFVEVPDDSEAMEDIASYSLSRNITQKYWPWKSQSAPFKKSLCDLEREIIRPSFAQDIEGKWHVIIQTDAFPQRVILEVCKNPGERCKSCSNLSSQCVQKYSHHQLISFDPESAETCPYIRLYKFPTSCVCRLN